MSWMRTSAGAAITVALLCFMSYIGSLLMQLLFVQSLQTLRSRYVFPITFALSTLMFVVVLIDLYTSAYNVISRGFLQSVLKGTLSSLLVLVTLIGPLQVCRCALADFGLRSATWNSVLALVIASGLLVLTSSALPSPARVPLSVGTTATRDPTILEIVTAKVAVLGSLAVGALSGYASVMTPYNYLYPFLMRHSGKQARQRAASLAKRQRYLLESWMSRKRTIALAEFAESSGNRAYQEERAAASGGSESGNRFVRWIGRALSGGSACKPPSTTQLEAECQGIENVSLLVFLQASEALAIATSAEHGSSYKGVVSAVVGAALALYSALQLVFTVISVALSRTSSMDPVTRAVGLAEQYLRLGGEPPQRLAAAGYDGVGTRGVSPRGSAGTLSSSTLIVNIALVFSTLMIVNSIRGFLATMFRLVSSYASSISSATTVWMFSVAMGMYFTAQLLMLRHSLPNQQDEAGGVLPSVLGQLSTNYYHRLIGVCYIVSFALTPLVHRFVLSRDDGDFDMSPPWQRGDERV